VPPDPLTITVAPKPDALGPLLDAVAAWSRAAALDPRVVHRLALLVEELASNVVNHGTAGADGATAVSVAIALEAEGVRLVVEDDGRAFDPLSLPTPDTDQPLESRRIGGLGVHLSRQVARSLAYAREGGRNRVVALLDARWA
jgi:anti-sigma regulatory factor (Ser/Thr protein kinase)